MNDLNPHASGGALMTPNTTETPESLPAHFGDGATCAAKTLTFDLGTHTGWALIVGHHVVDSGTVLLATDEELAAQQKEGRERTMDIRFVRFLEFLESKSSQGASRFVFEDVLFTRGAAQAQLWSSLRAAIWAAALRAKTPVFCVPVATLKKFASGNGGAQKEEMAKALATAEPGQYTLLPATGALRGNGRAMDDNEVDAIWLARFTLAVDRGEQKFCGVHQRKAAIKAEKRAKRIAAKAAKKARRAAETLTKRAEHAALMASIKASGKCCGVFRKPALRGRAICRKCGLSIRVPKPVIAEGQVASQACTPAPSVTLAELQIRAGEEGSYN